MIGIIRKIKGKECYFLDGKQVTKAVFDKTMDLPLDRKPVNKRCKRGYPIKSVACAVISKNAKKAEAEAAKRGVPTEYTKGGRPILRDAQHRKQFLKAFGLHDRNSYNGY